MPRVLVNGVHIYYESHGEGFPLVLAYGLGGNTTEWALQIPAFSRQYPFIVWDPRGHGQSDSPPNLDQYGSGTSAYDQEVAADVLGIDHVTVRDDSTNSSLPGR